MEGRITRIRPLGFGEILDIAFRIYKKRFAPIFVLTLLLCGPFYFLNELLGWLVGLQSVEEAERDVIIGIALMIFLFIIFSLIMIILWPLWHAAITGISSGIFLRNIAFTWIDGLKLIGKYGLKSVLTFLIWIVVALGLGLVFSILLVAGIFFAEASGMPDWMEGTLAFILILLFIFFLLVFSIRFSLMFPVIIEEGVSCFGCLKRSWELTKSSFWRIFGLLFILVLFDGIISSIPSFINQIFLLNSAFQSITLVIIVSLTTTFFFCIAAPLKTIVLFLVYIDRRARREGFDLEQRVAQLENMS